MAFRDDAPGRILISPVPVAWGIGNTTPTDDTEPMVVLTFHHPVGRFIHTMSVADARQMADTLNRQADDIDPPDTPRLAVPRLVIPGQS